VLGTCDVEGLVRVVVEGLVRVVIEGLVRVVIEEREREEKREERK